MRSLLAGLISLLLGFSSLAQSAGEVESIGLGGHYRSDCWVPMVVRIKPAGLQSKAYELRVHQNDPDGDQVIYKKSITITGAESGGQEQRFWMYFLPQPRLPNANGSYNLSDLRKALRVTLNSDQGKELATLPVTSMITNVDPAPDSQRSTKLVLCVSDGNSVPVTSDFNNRETLLGLLEDYAFVTLKATDLPESPLGYQAADYVVWLGADPAELRRGSDSKMLALQAWIKQGGNLVICTPADWQKTLEFGDLLPVKIEEVRNAPSLSPLKNLARKPENRDVPIDANDPWEKVRGPYRVARATALPGSVTDEWVKWDADGKDKTPWLVRKSYGAGSVTWVAQDLGDRLITSYVKTGWPFVWNQVLGLSDSPFIRTSQTNDEAREFRAFGGGSSVDIGASLFSGVDLTSTSSLLVTIAILFFIIYWFIAGPGSFLYLASKKKSQYSWLAFGICALGATALTVVIVKLVLRGPPQAKHVTYVRAVAGEPAIVQSRIGLYIPRDGAQKIEISKVLPNQLSYISPLPLIVKEVIDSKAAVEYSLPIRELASDGIPSVTVPYRSTLKKFKTQWIGEMTNRVEGQASLVGTDFYLSGKLTNGTGKEMTNIYFAFNYPQANPAVASAGDLVFYLPRWKDGVTLDLQRLYKDEAGKTVAFLSPQLNNVPENDRQLWGRLAMEWSPYWYSSVRAKSGVMDPTFDDFGQRIERSFPMLSLFSRLSPMQNGDSANRMEIKRQGARGLDVSGAIAGGSLVILAQATGKLPYPATVEGDALMEEGPIYYQFVLPLDRTVAEKELQEAAK